MNIDSSHSHGVRRASLAFAAATLIVSLTHHAAEAQFDPDIDGIPGVSTPDDDKPQAEAQSPAIGTEADLKEVIYAQDPLANTKINIERHLGVYLVKFPQRDPLERINIKGRNVEADLWHSIGASTEDDLACKAIRWLVFGRTQWALGARGIFSNYPDLNKLSLHFINIKKRDVRKQRVKSDVIRYMSVSISRNKFNKIDVAKLTDELQNRSCSAVARDTLSSYRFNQSYYNTYQEDR